jgi:phospholipase/carboxylesterase
MYDLPGLTSVIDENGYVYAFPNAPYRMPIGPGMMGYSWALQQGVEPPAPGMPEVPELMEGFMTEVIAATGAVPGQIVLGGFSQGGGLTLRYGLPRPEIFAGLIVLSGAFRDPAEVEKTLPPQRTQSIFIAHGRHDPMIDLERGQATRDFLTAAGYNPDYHEYAMGHEITMNVVRDLVPWLHATLPPKA